MLEPKYMELKHLKSLGIKSNLQIKGLRSLFPKSNLDIMVFLLSSWLQNSKLCDLPTIGTTIEDTYDGLLMTNQYDQ